MSIELPAYVQNLPRPLQQSIAVMFMAWTISFCVLGFCVLPKKGQFVDASVQLQSSLSVRDNMKADIAKVEEQRNATAKLQTERDSFLANHALEPLLGSLAMRAKSVLSLVSQQTGFVIDNVKELPAIPLRAPTPAALQLYSRQPVEFLGHGSYQQIMDFVSETEKQYPYVTLAGLTILAQAQTPEVHKAVIMFEWPAKGDKRQPAPTNQNQ